MKKVGYSSNYTKKFIKGLITDGDIRRVLNSSSKQRNLNKITRNYPLVINENMSASKALAFMSEKITSCLLFQINIKIKRIKF